MGDEEGEEESLWSRQHVGLWDEVSGVDTTISSVGTGQEECRREVFDTVIFLDNGSRFFQSSWVGGLSFSCIGQPFHVCRVGVVLVDSRRSVAAVCLAWEVLWISGWAVAQPVKMADSTLTSALPPLKQHCLVVKDI